MQSEDPPRHPPWPKVDIHVAPKSVKEVFIKFGLLSTVRGIPRIFKARNIFLSVFWAVIVVAFLTASLYQTILIVSDFFRYHVYQEHTIRLSQTKRFPDITVCSLQPFRSSRSLRQEKLIRAEVLVNEYFYNVSKRFSNFSKEEYFQAELKYYKGEAATTFTWDRKMDYGNYEDEIDLDYDYDAYNTDEEISHASKGGKRVKRMVHVPKHHEYVDNETIKHILMTTSGLYQNTDSVLRNRLGHQRDIIDDCNYIIQNGKHLESIGCRVKVFHYPQFFNCYTISRPAPMGVVLEVDLKLFLDDDVQMLYPKHYSYDNDAQKHGIRVVVHDAYTFPDVHTNGRDVPPGMAVNFNLQTKKWTHLPKPYGNCSSDTLFLEDHNGRKYRYVQHSCEEQCIQRKINEQCHCIDPSLITDSKTSKDPKQPDQLLPFCANISSSRKILTSRLACMYDFRFNPPRNCPCPLPCKRYEYTSSVDMAVWPHESFHLPLYQTTQESRNLSFPVLDNLVKTLHPFFYGFGKILEEQDIYSDTESIAVDKLIKTHLFQRNFVSVKVVRPTCEVHYVVDRPTVDISTLMSRVGGLMNFWLGITFITVMEFVEVVYDSILLLSRKNRAKRKLPADDAEKSESSLVES